MAKSVKLKDRLGNQILPITRATTVEMSDGTNMQEKLDSIKDNILEVNYNSGNTALVFGSSAKYTITLTGNVVNSMGNITVNGESKNTSDFPMEVDKGSNLSFECPGGHVNSSVVMGSTDITSSVRTFQNYIYLYDITNIIGDIVVTVNSSVGGGAD